MKYLLFFAAVVLYCTQVLHASPYTFVHQSGGGGSKTVRTTTFSTVKSGRFGNDDDDDDKISFRGHGDDDDDDDDDKKGCSHGRGRGDGDDDDDDLKRVIIAGHNGKTTTTTTVVKSSSGKIGRDNDDDDDKKGCSHGKGRGDGDDDDDDDNKKVIIAGHNGKTTTTTTVVKSSSGKFGKDDDDDDDKTDLHNKMTLIQDGNGAQKWHGEWHFGNSGGNDDNDCKICQGNGQGHDDDDDDHKKVKITTGKNGQTTTKTTTYVIKAGDTDGSQKWHGEWHFGNSDGKDDDGKGCEAIFKQLQAANAQIAFLKDQISKQETEHNTQILVYKNVIQKWTVDYTTLENQVNIIIAESKSWQSKYEVELVAVTQLKQVNIQLNINLKEAQTTLITLQKNVEQIKSSCKNNDKELIEWKHKYEILVVDSDTYKKQVKELTNISAENKKVIKEMSEKLSSCQNNGNQLSIDIINIKNILEVVKKNLADCELDKINLNDALTIQINEYNADQLSDHQQLLIHKKTEAELNHCRAQVIEIDKNYKAEKSNVLNCRNEINIIRQESTTFTLKYENDMKKIQTSVDQCKASLKIEIDSKNSCTIENKKYLLQITEIEYQLTVSKKAVTVAESKYKLCHDDANNLKISMEVIERNMAETTNLLKKCGDSSTSTQTELTSCQSNNDKCLRDLVEVKEKWSKSESRVTQLETDNSSLDAGKKRCEGNLSKLRCDINKQLAANKKIIDKASEKSVLVKSTLDKNKATIKKFVSTHNLTCVKPK